MTTSPAVNRVAAAAAGLCASHRRALPLISDGFGE
jgi:hypothetical protein